MFVFNQKSHEQQTTHSKPQYINLSHQNPQTNTKQSKFKRISFVLNRDKDGGCLFLKQTHLAMN